MPFFSGLERSSQPGGRPWPAGLIDKQRHGLREADLMLSVLELVKLAWRRKAPKRLLAEFDLSDKEP